MARRVLLTDRMESFAQPDVFLDASCIRLKDFFGQPPEEMLADDLWVSMKLAHLSSLQAVVFMYWLRGLSQYQIADKLKRSRSTIQVALRGAKSKMHSCPFGVAGVLIETFGIDAVRTLDDG